MQGEDAGSKLRPTLNEIFDEKISPSSHVRLARDRDSSPPLDCNLQAAPAPILPFFLSRLVVRSLYMNNATGETEEMLDTH